MKIVGKDFIGVKAVKFGPRPAVSFKVASESQIIAVAPKIPAPEEVQVTVTAAAGSNTTT